MNLQASLLIGVWALVSFDKRGADGRTLQPFGADAAGQLIYHPSGHMSASVMARRRPLLGMPIERMATLRPGPRLLGALLRFMGGARQHVAYTGRFRVEPEGRVVHSVETASLPDWVGTELERQARLEGEELVLSWRDTLGAEMRLRWRRV